MARRPLSELTPGEAALTPEEGLIVIGLAAIACDGKIDPVELPELMAALKAAGIPAGGSDEQREDVALRLVGLCDREGMDAMLGSALEALRDPARREAALALSLRLVVCDGVIPREEFDYIRELHLALEVSIDRYEQIVAAALAVRG